eukprot:TRINITY_DN4194_c1_g1_i1.p2 TRINITY_DN4194_c1_g1~~TRINITY_DN4194_c1_g1_i1.p2  ORF type:complete len:63 (+),score=0.30 TRINITY_DN4194_c1_g1_i1:41-229(+)
MVVLRLTQMLAEAEELAKDRPELLVQTNATALIVSALLQLLQALRRQALPPQRALQLQLLLT